MIRVPILASPVLVLLVAGLLPAAQQDGPPRVIVNKPRGGSDRERALAASILGQRMLTTCRQLAAFGDRRPGTRGSEAALNLLMRGLRSHGLKTQVARGDRVPYWNLRRAWLTAEKDGSHLSRLQVLAGSPSLMAPGLELVSAARKESLDGCLVAAVGGDAALQRRITLKDLVRFKRRGALAVILGPGHAPLAPLDGRDARAPRLPLPVLAVEADVAGKLEQELDAGRHPSFTVTVQVSTLRSEVRSLIATLPGDPADAHDPPPWLVISAPLSLAPGSPAALGSAAPCAVLAEVARALAISARSRKDPLRLRGRRIAFAFWGSIEAGFRAWITEREARAPDVADVLAVGPLGPGVARDALFVASGPGHPLQRVMADYGGQGGFWKDWQRVAPEVRLFPEVGRYALPLKLLERTRWAFLSSAPLRHAPAEAAGPGPRIDHCAAYGTAADVFRAGEAPAGADLVRCARALVPTIMRLAR